MKGFKIVTIFLASSSELAAERDLFRLFISGLNDKIIDKKVYLKIIQWENFLDAISNSRSQDEYNNSLKNADLAVCLFFTKVGKYTEEEFNTAYVKFKATGKPKIWTYFKKGPIDSDVISKEINSLLNFKENLKQLGHFYTSYTSTADLQNKFRDQLDIVLPELILKHSKATTTHATKPANNNDDDSVPSTPVKPIRKTTKYLIVSGILALTLCVYFIANYFFSPDPEKQRIINLKNQAGKVNDIAVYSRYNELLALMSDNLKMKMSYQRFSHDNDSINNVLGEFIKPIDTSVTKYLGSDLVVVTSQYRKGVLYMSIMFDPQLKIIAIAPNIVSKNNN